jgi:AraC-like DNA-binding protein
MPLQQLDVIVRVAGATLLVLAVVTSRARMGAARTWFVPFAACLCGFLAGNSPDPDLQLGGPLGRLAVILAGYAAVFLWWFCLAVFDARFRPRGAVLALGLAWIAVASADRGLLGPALADRGLSWILVAMGFAMVGHLAWRLLRDREGDLVDRRRRVRRAVVALLAGQLLADLAVDLALGLEWQSQAFSVLQNAAFLAFTAWLLSLAPTPAAPQAPAVEPVADPLLARLRRLMDEDRAYLDPELAFADVVAALGAQEKAVRRLINHQLGHDHFRTFVNGYRVAEAKRRLADPAHRSDKLIAIALDSGFASLPSFNRVFREMEGRSPGAFRDAALAAPAVAAAVF